MTTSQTNSEHLDDTLGRPVSEIPSPALNSESPLRGRHVTLTGLVKEDIPSLWYHLDLPTNQSLFAYLPFAANVTDDPESFWIVLEGLVQKRGFVLFAIKADPENLGPQSRCAEADRRETLGLIGYLDIQPSNRAVEIGCVIFSPRLQRTVAATETQYLMLRHAFGGVSPDSAEDDGAREIARTRSTISPGYRRVVWKCNTLNLASRRAAERLGFVYEGTLRNHMIAKGRSRDSDFLSILDSEWPVVNRGFEKWLSDDNFDQDGQQKTSLQESRNASLADPSS